MVFRKPKTLDEWLGIATRGLCPETQARIREEVEAHYMETLRAELAKGEGDLEALLNAGRSLGNARVARRQFHRRHLTTYEARIVDCFSESATLFPRSAVSRKRLSICSLGGIFMLTFSLFNTVPTIGQLTAIVVFIPTFTMTTIAFWNPPRHLTFSEKFQWRARIAAIQAILTTAVLLCIGNLGMFSYLDDLTITEQFFSEFGFRFAFGFLAAICLWDAGFNLSIARKVRGQDETPQAT